MIWAWQHLLVLNLACYLSMIFGSFGCSVHTLLHDWTHTKQHSYSNFADVEAEEAAAQGALCWAAAATATTLLLAVPAELAPD